MTGDILPILGASTAAVAALGAVVLGVLNWRRQRAADDSATRAAESASKAESAVTTINGQEGLIAQLQKEVADHSARRASDWAEFQAARKADRELADMHVKRLMEAQKIEQAEAMENLRHRLVADTEKELVAVRQAHERCERELVELRHLADQDRKQLAELVPLINRLTVRADLDGATVDRIEAAAKVVAVNLEASQAAAVAVVDGAPGEAADAAAVALPEEEA